MTQAAQAYDSSHKLFGYLVRRLESKLHETQTMPDPNNWGLVGDIDLMNEHLMVALQIAVNDLPTDIAGDIS